MVNNLEETIYSNQQMKKMLTDMMLIRSFEEAVEKLFQEGKIPGTMHLCIGQEATAVGACAALTDEDKITSTHRGHGHSIAKGTEIKPMMAELLGKATGYGKGKGGSMHIADLTIGNLGANGIVAAGLPIGTGAALASQMKKKGYVVLCFFGDGAANEGAFHEALNLASIWNLPVVFFCENNQYGMSGPVKEMVNIEHISDRAKSYGIPGFTINGNDVIEVAKATQEAVDRARSGEGPTLIEAETYRWRGHSRSDARKYRTREEEKDWRNTKDPISKFKERLIEESILTEKEFLEIQKTIDTEIHEAVSFAEESPEPSLDTLEVDIYV